MSKKYWLLKSEASVYSIADLKRDGKTSWEGVRNYQARNFMRDEMQVGDPVLIYHSNSEPTGVAGLARIARAAYPDDSAWDRKSRYYDAKSSKADPRWVMVDVQFVEQFPEVLPLAEMKTMGALKGMMVLQKGSRLSIQPVCEGHYNAVVKSGRRSAAAVK